VRTIIRSLVAVVAATLLVASLATNAATAAPKPRPDLHKIFKGCNGFAAADQVSVDTAKRVAFASSTSPTQQEITKVMRAGGCVGLSVGDRGIQKALNGLASSINPNHLRGTIVNNGVRFTLMITTDGYRVGWDIGYVRR
jgi:hypothetical protein